jgi:plastocyanin
MKFWAPYPSWLSTMARRFTAAMAALSLLALTVGCGSSSKTPPVQVSGSAAAVEIAETDSGFEPKTLTVGRGAETAVTFVNKGKVIHNLRIAGGPAFMSSNDLVIGDPVVQPGQRATKTWLVPDQAGTVRFRCDVHPNHTGTSTVR